MDNHHRSHSRLRTPWDDFKERTPSQEFIRTVYIEHYNSRHLNLQDSNESKLLNSYQPSRCPYCSSSEFRLFGKTRNGIQRYQCENPDCRRTFTVTIFCCVCGNGKPSLHRITHALLIILATIPQCTLLTHSCEPDRETHSYCFDLLYL